MRRRGLFYTVRRKQIYFAALLGVFISAYTWIPTIKQLESKRRSENCDRVENASETSGMRNKHLISLKKLEKMGWFNKGPVLMQFLSYFLVFLI